VSGATSRQKKKQVRDLERRGAAADGAPSAESKPELGMTPNSRANSKDPDGGLKAAAT
jgi:hypothetical protein